MPEVEVQRRPCEDCGATGRCATCGGRERLADGTECTECVEGKCLLCLGTGTARDFYVGGKLHTGTTWHFRWRDWLEIGSLTVLLGAVALWMGSPAVSEGAMIILGIGCSALGVAMIGLGLRQFLDDRAVERAMDREFPPM